MRFLIGLLTVFFFILGLCFPAFAQENISLTQEAFTQAQTYSPLTIYTGLRGGYYKFYPKDSQIDPYYGGGISWGGFVSFASVNGLGLDFAIDYYSEGNRSATAPPGTALTIIPITSSLKYNFFPDNAISPFIGGGIGVYRILECDPDYTYLQTYKFGKHILAGLDIFFPQQTVLKFEVRQTFIDEVSSSLYYRANFGGWSASVGIAFGMFPPQEIARKRNLYFKRERLRRSRRDLERRLRALEAEQAVSNWQVRQYEIEQIKAQIESTQSQSEEITKKLEEEAKAREQKRQEYLQEKLEKRQEKKEEMLKK